MKQLEKPMEQGILLGTKPGAGNSWLDDSPAGKCIRSECRDVEGTVPYSGIILNCNKTIESFYCILV